jgi:C4-type Zn-finger protein
MNLGPIKDTQNIPCPHCKRTMKVVRSVPRVGAVLELRIFSCAYCGEVEAKEIAPTL